MLRASYLRSCFADRALWFDQFNWVQQLATLVTLVSSSILVLAKRTFSTNKPICKKHLVFGTEGLLKFLFSYQFIRVEFCENILSNDGVFFSRGPAENVEVNIEVFINFFMNCVIIIAYFFWRFLLLKGLHFRSCSILISTANIYRIISS